MGKKQIPDREFAGLLRRGGLQQPSEAFTDRVMQAVERLPRPALRPNGSARKAWFFFALGTVLVVPAVLLLGWLLSLYQTWLPELNSVHVQYFSYAMLLLFSLFVLYQFDLLLKYRFSR